MTETMKNPGDICPKGNQEVKCSQCNTDWFIGADMAVPDGYICPNCRLKNTEAINENIEAAAKMK